MLTHWFYKYLAFSHTATRRTSFLEISSPQILPDVLSITLRRFSITEDGNLFIIFSDCKQYKGYCDFSPQSC